MGEERDGEERRLIAPEFIARPVTRVGHVAHVEQHELVTCVVDAQSHRACWGRWAQWLFELRSNETVTQPRRIDFDRPMRAFAP